MTLSKLHHDRATYLSNSVRERYGPTGFAGVMDVEGEMKWIAGYTAHDGWLVMECGDTAEEAWDQLKGRLQ